MTDTAQEKPGFNKALVEAKTYDKQPIWLPAMAVHHINAGQRVIDGKTFTDCLIEGPAVLMATDNVQFDNCNMGIASDPKTLLMKGLGDKVTGVIPFSNTRFVRCRFVGVAFTGHPDFMKLWTAETISQASSRLTSWSLTDVSSISPMPCQAKTRSVITAPPRIAPTSSATTVVRGMSAHRSACRTRTRRRVSPLAVARRM